MSLVALARVSGVVLAPLFVSFAGLEGVME